MPLQKQALLQKTLNAFSWEKKAVNRTSSLSVTEYTMRGMEALSPNKALMKKRSMKAKRPSREVMVVEVQAHPFGCAPWDPNACPKEERRVVEPPWWDAQVAGTMSSVYEVTPTDEDDATAALLAKEREEAQSHKERCRKEHERMKARQQPKLESFKMKQLQSKMAREAAKGATTTPRATPKNPRGARRPSKEMAEALRACGLTTAGGLRAKQKGLTIVRDEQLEDMQLKNKAVSELLIHSSRKRKDCAPLPPSQPLPPPMKLSPKSGLRAKQQGPTIVRV